MEPTWMYDQFSAATENDFVASLRASGDDYAIQTMKNHWGGYIPDSALDTIQVRKKSLKSREEQRREIDLTN